MVGVLVDKERGGGFWLIGFFGPSQKKDDEAKNNDEKNNNSQDPVSFGHILIVVTDIGLDNCCPDMV